MAKPNKAVTTPKGTLVGFTALEIPSPKFDCYNATILIEGDDGDKVYKYLEKVMKHHKKNTGCSNTHKPYTMTDAGPLICFSQ